MWAAMPSTRRFQGTGDSASLTGMLCLLQQKRLPDYASVDVTVVGNVLEAMTHLLICCQTSAMSIRAYHGLPETFAAYQSTPASTSS